MQKIKLIHNVTLAKKIGWKESIVYSVIRWGDKNLNKGYEDGWFKMHIDAYLPKISNITLRSYVETLEKHGLIESKIEGFPKMRFFRLVNRKKKAEKPEETALQSPEDEI